MFVSNVHLIAQVYSLSAQSNPLYPFTHSQANVVSQSSQGIQIPPFRHGLGWHFSSTETIRDFKYSTNTDSDAQPENAVLLTIDYVPASFNVRNLSCEIFGSVCKK